MLIEFLKHFKTEFLGKCVTVVKKIRTICASCMCTSMPHLSTRPGGLISCSIILHKASALYNCNCLTKISVNKIIKTSLILCSVTIIVALKCDCQSEHTKICAWWVLWILLDNYKKGPWLLYWLPIAVWQRFR